LEKSNKVAIKVKQQVSINLLHMIKAQEKGTSGTEQRKDAYKKTYAAG
jgi:hypothetical protein